VDRHYTSLVRALRARGRRARRIKKARGAWARRANIICGRALRDIRTTTLAAAPIRTQREFITLVSKLDTIESGYIAQLRAVPQPRHDAPKVEKILELSGQALSLDRAAVSALERNDRAAFRRLARQELRVSAHVDAIAAALGAVTCTENPFTADYG